MIANFFTILFGRFTGLVLTWHKTVPLKADITPN